MDESTATNIMAQALDSRSIAYSASESEAQALGRPYVAPVVPAAPAIPATPAEPAKALTVDEQVAELTAPNLGATAAEQASIAGAFNNPPASPGHYDFRPADGRAVDPAIDGPMRAMFHAEGISLGTGNEIARQWNAAAANPPNEAQIATQQAGAMAELSRSGNADETIALARSEVDRLEARLPGVKDMLAASGLGNNVWLIRTMAARAMARKP